MGRRWRLPGHPRRWLRRHRQELPICFSPPQRPTQPQQQPRLSYSSGAVTTFYVTTLPLTCPTMSALAEGYACKVAPPKVQCGWCPPRGGREKSTVINMLKMRWRHVKNIYIEIRRKNGIQWQRNVQFFIRTRSSDDMVKLTDDDIRWMVKRVSSGNFTVKQASWTYGITKRRVQQLTKI